MDNRKWESGAAAAAPEAPAAPSSGYPTNGDPLASVPPTVPGDYWFHQIGEELRAVIVAAGIAPDSASLIQLLSALRSAGVFSTPAQFDTSTKAATMEAVQRALGSFSGIATRSTNNVCTASDVGKMIYVSAASTQTLPSAAAIPAGACLNFFSAADGVVVAAAGTDTINGLAGTSVTAVSLNSKESVFLRSNGNSGWLAFSGSAQLGFTAGFANSLGAAGYQKLPSGLIVQWGTWTASGTVGNPVAVTFPIAFPSACDNVISSAINAATTASGAWYDTPSVGGFNGRCSVASLACRYFAIGR